MRVNSNILYDGDAGGAGGGGGGGGGSAPAPLAFDIKTMAPPEFQADPSLAAIKTVPDLVKSYVHGQKLVGQKRLAAPEAGWEQKQWDELYTAIGRPDSPDKYELPKDVKLADGLEIDEEAFKEIRKQFHGHGITDRQFKGIMTTYFTSLNKRAEAEKTAQAGSAATAMEALKKDWGQDFESNVAIAKSVLGKFADPDGKLGEYLETSKMGNNTELIKLLNKVGKAMLEDTQRGGTGGGGLHVGDAEKAKMEIERLGMDKEFVSALNDATHPMHGDAVKRRMNLFKIAYPGKEAGV